MIAESLLRILNKLRGVAVELGTFHLPVLGRTSPQLKDDVHLPAHDAVLSPLLAKAVNCRVYGVSRQSRLLSLLEAIGERRGRVWHLDLRRELIRGYEPLWIAECEHRGIAIASRLTLEETQPILDSCGCPDAWGSRHQLLEGNSKAAVSYCYEVAKSGEAFAFLIPGSNGLEWMDVFADKERLPVLWDQAMRKRFGGSDGSG
jgi:hypothetical protein